MQTREKQTADLSELMKKPRRRRNSDTKKQGEIHVHDDIGQLLHCPHTSVRVFIMLEYVML